ALVAAFFDDVGRTELEGQLLSWLVAAHGDDALGAEVLGGQHGEEPHGSVADNGDRLARRDLGSGCSEPAGAEDVGGGEEAGDEVVGWDLRGGNEGAVGERDPGELRLCANGAHQFAVEAGALVAGAADLARVVGSEERPDDEL